MNPNKIILLLFSFSNLININFSFFRSFQSFNNVCKSYSGYLTIHESPDCYYSPDLYASVPDISLRYTNLSETHTVTTEDGYILQIFRIPRPSGETPRGVILLHHPLFTDANIWLNQENGSIALFFWKSGYDIWLPNDRGTKYSLKHVNLTVDDPEFWDFSYHEIGVYDNTAYINYITNFTGQKVIYIGHSLATTASFVYASLKPDEAKKSVKVFVEMAPIAILRNIRGASVIGTFLEPFIRAIFQSLNINALFPYYNIYIEFLRNVLIIFPIKRIINFVISWFSGWSLNEFDPRFFNELFSEFPSGTSTHVLYHFSQNRRSGDFRMYDYGMQGNLQRYGNTTPPLYPLNKISTPLYFVYSVTDAVSTAKDSEILFTLIPQIAQQLGHLKLQGINHVDYHYGKDRMAAIYYKVLDVIWNL